MGKGTLVLAVALLGLVACDGENMSADGDKGKKVATDGALPQGPGAGAAPIYPEDLPSGLSSTSNVIVENDFKAAADAPLSTFAVDVDTAAYSMARRYLESAVKPPKDAVRIEEFVNYFAYDYAPPTDGQPFAIHADVAEAPWKKDHRLVRIGLKGAVVEAEQRPAANLVFLIDTSGSMAEETKLPLLKATLRVLVDQLNAADRIGIVTYAGGAGIRLMPTPGDQKDVILAAIDGLTSGGGTNGEGGIAAAYDLASANMVQGGVNRVLLCTDGDFNLGQTNADALVSLIRGKAEGGIYLTTLGFGQRFNDAMMETLADKGNGNYAYIDDAAEGERVLGRNVLATLVTIAKDVKVQVAMDPAKVAKYRLLGYENRALNAEDFKDDSKDGGEIGSGHVVTALYEVELAAGVDPKAAPAELMTVTVRYMKPTETTAQEVSAKVTDAGAAVEAAADDFRFAAAAAGFAMVLRDSAHKGDATYASVKALAAGALGADLAGERKDFVTLVEKAAALQSP